MRHRGQELFFHRFRNFALTHPNTLHCKIVASLNRKFLPVFWLLRLSDWLQGPYFFAVYSTKLLSSGVTPSLSMVSLLFLTGFASTAIFGPSVGRATDRYGRKKATIAFTIIYAVGALSTKSNVLYLLLAGRIFSGIGTALLFSAPESWVVSEVRISGDSFVRKTSSERR